MQHPAPQSFTTGPVYAGLALVPSAFSRSQLVANEPDLTAEEWDALCDEVEGDYRSTLTRVQLVAN